MNLWTLFIFYFICEVKNWGSTAILLNYEWVFFGKTIYTIQPGSIAIIHIIKLNLLIYISFAISKLCEFNYLIIIFLTLFSIPESARRYVESDVNIHYKTPIRYEIKDPISDAELIHRQEQAKKLYQEERRRKYLQELQDLNNRRHTDNFTPSQKSPISLHRYDDFGTIYDYATKSPNYPKTIARALYNFQGQTSRFAIFTLLIYSNRLPLFFRKTFPQTFLANLYDFSEIFRKKLFEEITFREKVGKLSN